MKAKPIPAARYKKLRESLDATQGEVADLLGVDRTTVVRRETGKFPVTVEAFLALERLRDIADAAPLSAEAKKAIDEERGRTER
jgi:DNA-binding XRE family transcriptional regulator